jgi:hydroxymethylglutaryl-CoA lyase
MQQMKILETPRDAMQGLENYIPWRRKVELLNAILSVGFDIVDIGSFVSPKAIPQFIDMKKVIEKLDFDHTTSDIFALVANKQGADDVFQYEQIKYIGYPFSGSATFLKKNINADFTLALDTIDYIQNLCVKHNKKFLLYESMAFGNPYGDPDGLKMIIYWTQQFSEMGIQTISLSDIIGVAKPNQIAEAYKVLTAEYSDIEFGIHLHVKGDDWYNKVDAAWKNGCTIFEGVITGQGGCPMTGYELLGNLPTGNIIDFAKRNNISHQIDVGLFEEARSLGLNILS